jgi:hypothetical protein
MSYIYNLEYKYEICAVIGISESENTKNISFKCYFFDSKVGILNYFKVLINKKMSPRIQTAFHSSKILRS